MPLPTLVFAALFATLLGALFHLVLGGGGGRMAQLLLAGWFGFALGHAMGVVLNIRLWNIGTLRFLPATVVALVVLALFAALSTDRAARAAS